MTGTVSIAIYFYVNMHQQKKQLKYLVFSKQAQNEGDMMQMMHVRQMKKV